MTLRATKPVSNIREKLSELDRPVGNHGSQLMKSPDITETFNLVQAGRKNIVINGDMSISQRYGTTAHTIPGANTYVLDRFSGWGSQSNKFSMQQVADAPIEEGLKYSNKCTSLSAFSAANGDWFGVNHRIEANNITQGLLGTANAKTFTLSFWVKSSIIGTWYGAIRTKGSSPDRSYPFEYTINTVNTWEKKTLTFTGAVNGTWGSGNAEGMCLWWDLGSEGNWHGSSYVWHSANKTGADASPFIAVNGATWYITGVQLELGPAATPFEHRSFGEELQLCQRYYQKSFMYANAPGTAAHQGGVHVLSWADGNGAGLVLPVRMRDAPDWRLWPTNSTNVGKVGSHGIERDATVTYVGETGYSYLAITSGTASTYVRFQYDVDAEL